MSRMLCIALSLSIIVSSLSGCATPPVKRAAVAGPEAFGYTLNQPLTADELKALTDARITSQAGTRMFTREDGQGGTLKLHLDSESRPVEIEKTSRLFGTEEECKAEHHLLVDELSTLAAVHNRAHRIPNREGLDYLPGEHYVKADGLRCLAGEGDPPDTFRYSEGIADHIATDPPKRSFGKRFDEAYQSTAFTIIVIALLPLVLIGAAVGAMTD